MKKVLNKKKLEHRSYKISLNSSQEYGRCPQGVSGFAIFFILYEGGIRWRLRVNAEKGKR